MLPARVLTRGAEANKIFLRCLSNTYTVRVAAAKREAEREETERRSEAMETQDACPFRDGMDGSKVGSRAVDGTPAPQAAVMGHANTLFRCQQITLGSHFFNHKYPYMDNRTLLSHWDWAGWSRYEKLVNVSIDRLMDGPRAFW